MKKALAVVAVATIIAIMSSSAVFADVVIYGRGSAHGVGMSMAGVYGMAKAGYNYQQISTYYYPNTTWGSRNDNTVIQAKCQKHGTWHTLTVKEYLYRLAEEPDTWPKEGIKSLIIAARTYLWYKLEKPGANGKMSGGQYFVHSVNPALRPNTVAAVNDTANQILTFNGRAIVAAYSGSAGGYTARMSEIWGGSDAPYPYLINRDSPFDSVFQSSFKWTKTLTNAAIEKAYPSIGSFKSLAIEQRTSADLAKSRVKTIRINGSLGSITDKGWNFKSKLKLKSNYFYLTPWPQESSTSYKPATYARRVSNVRRLSRRKARHYLNLYRRYKTKYRRSRSSAGRRKYLRAAKKYYSYYRLAKRGLALVKLYWKVLDSDATDNVAYVKLVVKKKGYTGTETKKKRHYFRLYKICKSRYKRTKNRRYYQQAKIYFRRYRLIRPRNRTVKVINYRWTTINALRAYTWKTRSRGTFTYLVYSRDRSGNVQKNVASGIVRIR